MTIKILSVVEIPPYTVTEDQCDRCDGGFDEGGLIISFLKRDAAICLKLGCFLRELTYQEELEDTAFERLHVLANTSPTAPHEDRYEVDKSIQGLGILSIIEKYDDD